VNKKPTTKIVLVPIAKKNGKYPVKLRVTFERKQRFYPCNIDLNPEEFDHIFYARNIKQDKKKIRDIAIGIQGRAIEIIDDLKTFSFKIFELKLLGTGKADGEVYGLFDLIFKELMSADRPGSAWNYRTTKNSLMSFKPNLTFKELTPEFLRDYENWLLTEPEPNDKKKSKAKSITTVGIYTRQLRAVYNRAIAENLVGRESYPFGRYKYIVPVGRNIKKALVFDEIRKIFHYQTTSNGWERKAKDFWCFSYLCNGMNIMDIAKLKYKDICDGEIHYERAKTQTTTRGKSNTIISIAILDQTMPIIKKWGNKDKSANNFVFPILDHDMSALRIKQVVQQFTKNINDYMKKIAKDLGIEKNVTTYTARHSYATVLKRSNVPVEVISENLGHMNISTTKSYLDKFESESRLKTAQVLVAFD